MYVAPSEKRRLQTTKKTSLCATILDDSHEGLYKCAQARAAVDALLVKKGKKAKLVGAKVSDSDSVNVSIN